MMKAADKKKLRQAMALLEQAEQLVAEVKAKYWENRIERDEFYGLEEVEIQISEAVAVLNEGFKL
jgi:hypothetical protein